MRSRLVRAALVLFLAIASAPVSAGDAAGAGTVVLDDGCYWRCFYSYAPPYVSPQVMEAEAKTCLGAKLLQRVERDTRSRLRRAGRKTDSWTRHVVATTGHWGFGARTSIAGRFRTPAGPSGWMKPGFNDSAWLRQRVPHLMGRFYRSLNMQVQQACFRTRFVVPDPAAVKGLVFRARYRGGIRVLLNGAEIGRGHLAADGGAVAYPAEAYVLKDGEYPEADYRQEGYRAQYWQKVNGRVLVPELPDRFDQLRKRKDTDDCRNKGNFSISRGGFDRLHRLRDRRIKVDVDPVRLRRGVNLLAVEVRRSPMHPWATQWFQEFRRNHMWYHGAVFEVELTAASGRAGSTLERPAGVQVWVEDVHRRLYAADFHEPAGRTRPARIIGARNGTYSAQIAVGTNRELRGLQVAVGPFRGPVGAAPTAAVRYGVPHKVAELRPGDRGRRIGNSPSFDYPHVITARYGSLDVSFFDHLSAAPPEKVPADSACAAWLAVSIPKDAASGTYHAAVTVEADGVGPVRVPLEVTVINWAVPAPRDFQTVMALEQSPYALARHYRVPLWSEEHWRLIEESFKQLARVGNDWVNVPVLSHTEFGNREDSPVRLSRKRDGSYAADFTIADRYIDLAVKHCGPQKVVNFVVMHAGRAGDTRMRPPAMFVHVRDEGAARPGSRQAGKREPLAVDRRMPEPERRRFWRFLSTAIRDHMRARGMERSLYWGYTWDADGCDPQMYRLLAEFTPGVYWTKGSHQRPPNRYHRAVATAYNSQIAVGFVSRKGWKRPELWLAYPRYWGTIIDCSDYSTPFSYRLMADRAIVAGARGIGRVGLDYWGRTYLDGLQRGEYPVGVPTLCVLWPGRTGPESSVRFEMMCEGLQEAEARVFLEGALEKLDAQKHAALVHRTQKVLDNHNYETLLDPPNASRYQLAESCALGWQARSGKLYAAAAEVAGVIGTDLETSRLAADVPARGRAEVRVKLRNWTRAPRRWALTTESDWIRPARTDGTVGPGQHELRIALDARPLAKELQKRLAAPPPKIKPRQAPPLNQFKGVLTFTDVASRRADPLEITAALGGVLDLTGPRTAFNVPLGERETLEFTVRNLSAAPLTWTASCSAPWATVKPAGGRIQPASQTSVRVTASPPGRRYARRECALTVQETGGASRTLPLVAYALPQPFSEQVAVGGKTIRLDTLTPVRHRDGRRRRGPRFWRPRPDRPRDKFAIGKKREAFAWGLIAYPRQEDVYAIEGKGFRSFTCHVGPAAILSSETHMPFAYRLRLCFEVWVDGELRAFSGLMGPTDGPKTLAVGRLDTAKRMRLVTRVHSDQDRWQMAGYWAEPVFLLKK